MEEGGKKSKGTARAQDPLLQSQEKDPRAVFTLREKLGEGSYGSVWRATDKQTGEDYAIKRVGIDNDLDDLQVEITFMRTCSSEYIVRYFRSYVLGTELWIVMDYCCAGSVSDLMKATNTTLSVPQMQLVTRCALRGLEYLHAMHKIHRDIKCGNILLNAQGVGKLADFGVSGQLCDTMAKRHTVIGSVSATPPFFFFVFFFTLCVISLPMPHHRHAHHTAVLDGARGHPGGRVQREGGHLVAGDHAHRDGRGAPAVRGRAPDARHLHDPEPPAAHARRREPLAARALRLPRPLRHKGPHRAPLGRTAPRGLPPTTHHSSTGTQEAVLTASVQHPFIKACPATYDSLLELMRVQADVIREVGREKALGLDGEEDTGEECQATRRLQRGSNRTGLSTGSSCTPSGTVVVNSSGGSGGDGDDDTDGFDDGTMVRHDSDTDGFDDGTMVHHDTGSESGSDDSGFDDGTMVVYDSCEPRTDTDTF